MRVAVIGGTRFVGPMTVRLLMDAGHEVCVAHTGAHEDEAVDSIEHLHGDRRELLGERGAVEFWGPDVLIDTFPGGATAEKGQQLARCAGRIGARVVAVSSMDVYQQLRGRGSCRRRRVASIEHRTRFLSTRMRESVRDPIRVEALHTTTSRWRQRCKRSIAQQSSCVQARSMDRIRRPGNGSWCG